MLSLLPVAERLLRRKTQQMQSLPCYPIHVTQMSTIACAQESFAKLEVFAVELNITN